MKELDEAATEQKLRDADVHPERAFSRDPNRRRILESLCQYHKVGPVYRELPKRSRDP